MDIDSLSRVDREALMAAATRALVDCREECRDILREQLKAEETAQVLVSRLRSHVPSRWSSTGLLGRDTSIPGPSAGIPDPPGR